MIKEKELEYDERYSANINSEGQINARNMKGKVEAATKGSKKKDKQTLPKGHLLSKATPNKAGGES